jgi:hypothetical protein
MSRILPTALACALFVFPARSQSFNVDFEPAVATYGQPTTTYGAAALSPGYWNPVSQGSGTSLVATSGAPTGVSLANNAVSDAYWSQNWPGTTGNDQALLDDFEHPDDYLITWTFSGLATGNYEVYTIVRSNNVGRLRVWVDGSPDPVEYLYGEWNGTYVEGAPGPGFPNNFSNYTRHTKQVTDGQIRVNIEVADNPADYVDANGIQLVKDGEILVGIPQCFGDGSEAPCPCLNSGTTAHGCQNSAGTGGGLLVASGTTSPDTLVLHSSGELPSALSIFLQGNATIAPVVYGDGLRCTGGILKRLYTGGASGGAISRPGMGDLSITARSAALGDTIPPGERRYYQVYFRDANPSFCAAPAGNTFNITNALKVTW